MELDQQMLQSIAQQVLNAIQQQDAQETRKTRNLRAEPKILTVCCGNGCSSCSRIDRKGYRTVYAANREQSGPYEGYSFLVVNKLTNDALAQTALGLQGCFASDAILSFLQKGKKVYIMKAGAECCKDQTCANTKLLELYAGYRKKLESYGAVFLDSPQQLVAESAQRTSPLDSEEKVITAQEAERLIKMNKNTVLLRWDAIVTPLAKDLFHDAGVGIRREMPSGNDL